MAAEFGPFCIMLFRTCPNHGQMQLFLVPYGFFGILFEETFFQVQHCSNRPQVQPVSLGMSLHITPLISGIMLHVC